MAPIPPKRPGSVIQGRRIPSVISDDRRDVRETKTPPPGLFDRPERAPLHVDEEVTGKYHGEELEEMRARRPTHDRIARTEKKGDELTAAFTGLSVTTAAMGGKLDTLVELAGAAAAERERRAAADAVERESKRKYIVPIITAIGVIIMGIFAAWMASK